MPDGNELRLLRRKSMSWIAGLPKKLEEMNIPFEIKNIPDRENYHRFGVGMKCEIYVRLEDWQQAHEVDQTFYIEQVPDAAFP